MSKSEEPEREVTPSLLGIKLVLLLYFFEAVLHPNQFCFVFGGVGGKAMGLLLGWCSVDHAVPTVKSGLLAF